MINVKVAPHIQSIRTKLSNLAKQQGVPFQQVLTIFLLERTAVRLLLDGGLARHLVFKGGFVGVRVYNSPRYTTDLDALAHGLSRDDAEQKIKAAMTQVVGDACWFEFEGQIDLKTQGEYGGLRFVYRGGVGDRPLRLQTAQIVHIDLGIGDPVTPGPRSVTTPYTIGEGHLSWFVYPVETILAEKLHALVTIGARNSRAKDVFDVGLLLPQTAKATLEMALSATFAFRGDTRPTSIAEVLSRLDTASLRSGWPSAVAAIQNAPGFDDAFHGIVRRLSDWGI